MPPQITIIGAGSYRWAPTLATDLATCRARLRDRPESRRAEPVRRALERPFDADCPVSILRTQAHVTLFLDRESAGLLANVP